MEQFLSYAGSVGLALAAVLVVIGVLFSAKYAIAYAKTALGEKQFNFLAGYAQLLVRALEQTGLQTRWSGEEKKQMAMSVLINLAEKYNLPFDSDLLEDLVEAAVNIMNGETIQLGERIEPEPVTGK